MSDVSKEEWMGCGCCAAVCVEPSVEVKVKDITMSPCGFRITQILNLSPYFARRVYTLGFNRPTTEFLGGSIKNTSRVDESLNKISFIGQHCDKTSTYSGSSTDESFRKRKTRCGEEGDDGEKPWVEWNEYEFVVSVSYGGVVDYNNTGNISGVTSATFVQTNCDSFDSGSCTPSCTTTSGNYNGPVSNIDQNISSFETLTDVGDFDGVSSVTYTSGPYLSESVNYSNAITVADFEAEIENAFDAVDEVAGGNIVFEPFRKEYTMINFNGMDYPTMLGLRRTSARIKIPVNHGGSYFAVKYSFTDYDENDVATESGESLVEWSGPGDQNDAEDASWFVDIDIETGGLLAPARKEIHLVSYRCYHGGAWQGF